MSGACQFVGRAAGKSILPPSVGSLLLANAAESLPLPTSGVAILAPPIVARVSVMRHDAKLSMASFVAGGHAPSCTQG